MVYTTVSSIPDTSISTIHKKLISVWPAEIKVRIMIFHTVRVLYITTILVCFLHPIERLDLKPDVRLNKQIGMFLFCTPAYTQFSSATVVLKLIIWLWGITHRAG